MPFTIEGKKEWCTKLTMVDVRRWGGKCKSWSFWVTYRKGGERLSGAGLLRIHALLGFLGQFTIYRRLLHTALL